MLRTEPGLLPAALVLALALTPSAAPAQEAPQEPGIERVTLQTAVQRSLDRNPTVAVALAEVRRAEGLLAEARAGSLPTVLGAVQYTRLDSDRVLSGRVISGVDQLSAAVALTVPLAVPARWAQWSHASENTDIARLSVADARRQVAVATARAALTVIAQRRTADALTLARDAARAHYLFAHARVAGGVGNRIDEVRAAQQVAVGEAQLQTAATAIVRAREALGVLVGSDTALDIQDPPTLAPARDPVAADDNTLVARRADLRVLSARIDAAEHVRRDTWTEYLPYLVGVFQPFYQNPPTLTQPQFGWQAQVLLTIPFYDGGIRQGEAREREALVTEARVALEGALRQARADVRAAFESVRLADAALDAARNSAVLADQALTMATTAYRAGATTNLDVIDAERNARDAATATAVAEDAARQARLDLLVAAGRFP